MGLMTIIRSGIGRVRRATSFQTVGGAAGGLGAYSWLAGTAAPEHAGVSVNEYSALSYNALWAVVRVISETLATLPLKVYRRLPGNLGKELDTTHRLYSTLHDQPNPQMTAFNFWECMVGHLCTWGNAYAEIVPDVNGLPGGSLWILPPNRVKVIRKPNSGIAYEVRPDNGAVITLPFAQVLHISGLGFDGLVGYSPIQKHVSTIGLGIAMERHSANFFGNGARPSGALTVPGSLGSGEKGRESRETMREEWERIHGGPDKSGKVGIFENGLEWTSIGLPNDVSQLLESRKLSIRDVARIYRMPPHKIGDLDNAKFNNIEHQGIEFTTNTIQPWCKRIEQAISLKLLLNEPDVYVRFTLDGLLRGDIKARYNAYTIGINSGFLTRNEVREMEDRNRADGLDEFLQPLNMKGATEGVLTGMGTDDKDDENDLSRSFAPVFVDIIGRISRKEIMSVKRGLKTWTTSDDARKWVEDFYRDFEAEVVRAISPAASSYTAISGIEIDPRDVARRYVSASRGQLLGIVRETPGIDRADVINKRLAEWKMERPAAAMEMVV